MKALTLTQPWASLVVARPGYRPTSLFAIKPIETRPWYIRPERLPMRLAIHAGLGIDRMLRAQITVRIGGVMREFARPYAQALALAGLPLFDPWAHPGRGVPIGAIIGCVTLTRIEPADQITAMWKRGQIDDLTYHLGNFSPGRFAWFMRDPFVLPRPIPIAGMQRLWTVPPPVACDIEAADPYYHAEMMA